MSKLELLKAKDVEKIVFGTEFIIQVNAETFHKNFKKAKETLQNNELVDLHDLAEYKETYNFLSTDFKSGFAITKEGDLISVFNSSTQKGFLKAIASFIKKNVKTLDCYKSKVQDLQSIYQKIFDFKVASVLDFNYDIVKEFNGKEYADNFIKKHGNAKVIFMVNTDKKIKTKYFNCNEYEQALEYRNSLVGI